MYEFLDYWIVDMSWDLWCGIRGVDIVVRVERCERCDENIGV